MANGLYQKWKENLLQATTYYPLTGTVKAALVGAGYTQNFATDQYWSVGGTAGPLASVVGTPVTLGSKTYTLGVLGAANTTFSAVASGTAAKIVLYVDTGTAATSPLVACIDTGVTNLPVTGNGGDITIAWNGSGIFAL